MIERMYIWRRSEKACHSSNPYCFSIKSTSEMIVINNSKQRWENILQINIVAESGIQVKRLREYIFGDEVKKLVILQIHIISQSREYK